MANHLSKSLGNYISHRQFQNGLTIESSFGYAEVSVYSDSVIRVRAYQEAETAPDYSYAVVGEAGAVSFGLELNEESIELFTGNIKLVISKEPLRFSFYSVITGALLSADDPAFGISWIGDQVTAYKTLQAEERFIGLGEKNGGLDKRGRAYTHWNTDFFGYTPDSDPIYASLPFYMGVLPNSVYGIFMDNPCKSYFNFGASNNRFASFGVEYGQMNYYFFHSPTVAGILADYTWLTGSMPMPPKWSLGYQQCRYSYYPATEVLSVARTFREKRIPADVVYLDIHYMDNYKIFTWDEKRFPEPEKMLAELREMGFRVVIIVDPGIKVEQGYEAYDSGMAEDVFVKYPDGSPYTAQVWPGWCHFPDFTKAHTRHWWGSRFSTYVKQGVRGFWNDMNEMATWGQCTPDLIEFDNEGNPAAHKQVRNVYGLQMVKSTYEGTKTLLGNERPFVLTRAAYCGIQRYGALWTGDNTSSDEHMLGGVRLVNSLGLTGVPYSGYDVGGFIGEASPALFARWIALGAFAPFFRGHSMINSRDQEPWAFGEEVEDVSRNYIGLRYRLLPYLYSVFNQATKTGIPVARSLAVDYTHDPKVYHPLYQNQYLFGPAILVVPAESTRDLVKTYLPEGIWYNFYSDIAVQGPVEVVSECPLELLPLYVKEGAIIPMQATIQYAEQAHNGVLDLHLYHTDSSNEFVYYEDDGISYDFEQGVFHKRLMRIDKNRFTIAEAEGSYLPAWQNIRLIFHGFEGLSQILVNGSIVATRHETSRMIEPVSSFDPLGKESLSISQYTLTALIDYSHRAIEITW